MNEIQNIIDISEAEFNEMNALQRQALADAVGLQNSELQKLVSAEKDAVSLQGELAKQNIDEIVSDKAITATAGLIKDLKVMGMQLAETVGPAVNLVVQAVGLLAKGLEKVGGSIINYFRINNQCYLIQIELKKTKLDQEKQGQEVFC